MKKSSRKVTFHLGSLQEPLEKACAESGRTLSDEIRLRLARSLKVPVPELPWGFATMTKAKLKKAARKGHLARRLKAMDGDSSD